MEITCYQNGASTQRVPINGGRKRTGQRVERSSEWFKLDDAFLHCDANIQLIIIVLIELATKNLFYIACPYAYHCPYAA